MTELGCVQKSRRLASDFFLASLCKRIRSFRIGCGAKGLLNRGIHSKSTLVN
jgi:hypothetical protein